MDRKKAKEWGSDIIRTRISRETYVLETRTWRDFQFYEWIFIIVALTSILISIGFSIYQLVVILIDKARFPTVLPFVFPVLVILNNVFSAYFLWNGVMEEMPFKLLLQLIIKTVIWIFDLIFFLMQTKDVGEDFEDDIKSEIRSIRFYVSSSMLFLTLTSGGFVIYQYWTSNIAIFRLVGTEPKYVRLCRLWNLCHSMIFFDAVIFLTVIFHLFNFPYFIDNYAVYYLVPLWLVGTVLYVLLGTHAIEKESRWMTYFFYAASHAQPIFVIFMLVQARRNTLGMLLYVSLYVTSSISFLTHICLLITLVRVQLAYGLGLKQAAAREVERKQLVTSIDDEKDQNDERVLQPSLTLNSIPPTETEL